MATAPPPPLSELSDAHFILSLFKDIFETQGQSDHFALDSRTIFNGPDVAKPVKLSRS